MKNIRLLFLVSFYFFCWTFTVPAQQIRWLYTGELLAPFSNMGIEYETEFTAGNSNFFTWQPQYGIDQNIVRAKALWMGCKNFYDPATSATRTYKVVGAGPKTVANSVDQVFPQEIKLIGKFNHPLVTVDDGDATTISQYDALDEVDPNLPCDRMIVIKFNTSMGITVTKKIMAFSQSDHGNYFMYDYVFKNTGIYNAAGNVYSQSLDSVWFYFLHRYQYGGVSASYSSTWGKFQALWGESNLYHAVGEDPTSSEFNDANALTYRLRGFYSYYGPEGSNPQNLTYDEDWGCPNTSSRGELASAKYAGCVTLHADVNASNHSDDVNQPRTTWYISPDLPLFTTAPNQYDDISMQTRWGAMTEGHPALGQQHDALVGTGYAADWNKPSRRNDGGGTAMSQGYGPYQMAPGDSIHIVFAEGCSGIGWEKGVEVGSNWLQYYKGTGTPMLSLPNGTTTTDYNAYKKAWIFTGRDSILKTFQNAKRNFDNNYNVPQAPPPPKKVAIISGGQIQVTWENADNYASAPHRGGFVVYRAEGSVMDWTSIYAKIFETNDPSVTSCYDTSAHRGFDNFYYVLTKDDGTQIPGETLYSGPSWTFSNTGAVMGMNPGTALNNVRVVPNPYDVRGRFFQFGDLAQYDRLYFYGLPPYCKLRIFTESGELIYEKVHSKISGDEFWDSKTTYGQIITSGIYILHVEVLQDTYDTWDQKNNRVLYRKGQSVFRKFVVIR